jgi:hypothetical protein
MTDTRLPERWLNDRRILKLTDHAYRSFFNALMWSVSNRTDGVIEPDDLKLIPGFDPGCVSELTDSGLWAKLRKGWLIDGFAVTQSTRDILEANDRQRAASRERKRRQRARESAGRRAVTRDVTGDLSHGTSRRTAQGQDRTGELRSSSSVSNQLKKETEQSLLNLGTELDDDDGAEFLAADAKFRTGRIASSLTSEAIDLVPPNQPEHIRNRLRMVIGELLNDGAAADDIQRAVDRWLQRLAGGEDIHPGHLRQCYSQVIAQATITPQQLRNGRAPTKREQRLANIQALKSRPQPARKEITNGDAP